MIGIYGALLATALTANHAGVEHLKAKAEKDLGHMAEAEAHYVKALQLWDEAGDEYLYAKDMTLMNLGQLHLEQRRVKEAEKELTEASVLAERFQSTYPREYPEALSRLGALYGQNEQPDRARPLLTKAIALFEKLDSDHNAELAYAHNSLGLTDVGERRLAEGEAHLREAIRLSESAQERLAYQTNLALTLILEKQYSRAETLLVYVRAGVEKLPVVPQQLLGTVLAELSAAALSMNKLSMAEEYAQQELEAMERQTPSNPLAIALARVNLANVFIEERRTEDAERILPDTVAEERRLRTSPRVLANAVRRLGELRALEHAWPESQALYREAIELYQTGSGPGNEDMSAILDEYAAAQKHGRGWGAGFRPSGDTVHPN